MRRDLDSPPNMMAVLQTAKVRSLEVLRSRREQLHLHDTVCAWP